MADRRNRLAAGALFTLLLLTACSTSVFTEQRESQEGPAVDVNSEAKAEQVDPFTVTELLQLPEQRSGWSITPWFDGLAVQPRYPGMLASPDDEPRHILDGLGNPKALAGNYRLFRVGPGDYSPYVRLPVTSERFLEVHKRGNESLRLEVSDKFRQVIEEREFPVASANDGWWGQTNAYVSPNIATVVVLDTSRQRGRILDVQVFDPQTLEERATLALPRERPWTPTTVHVARDGSRLWLFDVDRISYSGVPSVAIGFDEINLDEGKVKPSKTLFQCGPGRAAGPCLSSNVGFSLSESQHDDTLWIVINPNINEPRAMARLIVMNTSTGQIVNEASDMPGLIRIAVDQDSGRPATLSFSPDGRQLLLQPIDAQTLQPVGEGWELPQMRGTSEQAKSGATAESSSWYWWAETQGSQRIRVSDDGTTLWLSEIETDIDMQWTRDNETLERRYSNFDYMWIEWVRATNSDKEIFSAYREGVPEFCVRTSSQLLEPGIRSCDSRDVVGDIPSTFMRTIALAPDEQTVWASPEREQGYLIQMTADQRVVPVKYKGVSGAGVWSPDSQQLWLLNAEQPRIDVIDARTGKRSNVIRLDSPPGYASWARFSPDGRYAVIGIYQPGTSSPQGFMWNIVDTETGEIRQTPFPIGGSPLGRPQFSPQSSRLWAGEGTNLIGLDLDENRRGASIPLPEIEAVTDTWCEGREVMAVTSDPERVWMNAWCGRLLVADVVSGAFVERFDLDGEIQEVYPLPDNPGVLVLTSRALYRIEW
jgi:hypothetical protein